MFNPPAVAPLAALLASAVLAAAGPASASSELPAVVELADLNTPGSLEGITFAGNAELDNLGAAVGPAGDLNGDGFADLAIGAPGSDAGGSDRGTVYVLFGTPGGFPSTLAPSDFDGTTGLMIHGARDLSLTGRAISPAGDFNGDGLDDLALSSPLTSTGTVSGGGETYVVFGRDDGGFPAVIDLAELGGTGPNATPGVTIRGAVPIGRAGYSIDGGGDINADGLDDLLIGITNAPAAPDGARRGQVVVLFGRNDGGFPAVVEIADLNGTGPTASTGLLINGATDEELLGGRVRHVGDVNGDGIDDLFIANGRRNPIGIRNYLVYGGASLPAVIELADLNGSGPAAVRGSTLTCATVCAEAVGAVGDFNADGVADFGVGEIFRSSNGISSGAAYIVFGSPDDTLPPSIELTEVNGTGPTAAAGIRIDGARALDFTGNAIAPAGDFNADGFDDVLVAASRGDTTRTEAGITYVVFGGPPNAGETVIDLGAFDQPGTNAVNGVQLNGVAVFDQSGDQVAAAGDLNSDGGVDLVIGAPNADRTAGMDTGEAYVVFGPPVLDVAVSKSNGSNFVRPGDSVTYTIVVDNLSDAIIDGVVVDDILPDTLDNKAASWTCTAEPGSVCADATGSGDIQTVVDLGNFGRAVFELTTTVVGSEPELVTNTVTVSLPSGTPDADPSNNQSSDRDPIGLFLDGFEGSSTSAGR
jgi:uncharacterized repeat protein (TIGR01451 family)